MSHLRNKKYLYPLRGYLKKRLKRNFTQGKAPMWSSWPCVMTTASILWLHFLIKVVSGIIFSTPRSSKLNASQHMIQGQCIQKKREEANFAVTVWAIFSNTTTQDNAIVSQKNLLPTKLEDIVCEGTWPMTTNHSIRSWISTTDPEQQRKTKKWRSVDKIKQWSFTPPLQPKK